MKASKKQVSTSKESTATTPGSQSPKTQVKPTDLRELMQEVVSAPTEVEHLSDAEYEDIQHRRQKTADNLADRLYELTNIERETDLNVYLETINSVVLDTCSEENQAVLIRAQDYFVQTFGSEIRRLGHSPVLLDQIVHRTGRETRDIVARTLRGFDVKLIAAQIREKARSFSEDAAKLAARVMYDLTHRQVRELRSYYTTIPGQETAAVLHHCLTRRNLKGNSFPDAKTIKYILSYRTQKEIAQIECQFNEIYHFDRSQPSELCFREQIQEKFAEKEASQILNLLEGFQPSAIADLVFEHLNNHSKLSEGLEGSPQLLSDFAGLFRSNKNDTLLFNKELAARSAIESLVSDLSIDQFNQVSAVLKQRYDINLTAELYPSVRPFDARHIANNLYYSCLNSDPRADFRRAEQYLSDEELLAVKDEFRLSKDNELKDIINSRANEKKALEALELTEKALSPLRFLTPEQLRAVAKAFKSLCGIKMEVFINETVANICRGDEPDYVNDYLFLILSGVGRQKLDYDLFKLFADKAKRIKENEKAKLKARTFAQIPALIESIQSVSSGESAKDLLNQISEYSLDQLLLLEESFVETQENSLPFLKTLETSLSSEAQLQLELLFAGINVNKLISEIYESPDILVQYLRLDSRYILLIRDLFQKKFDISLYDFLQTRLLDRSQGNEDRTLQHCLLFCLAPEVQQMNQMISQCGANSLKQTDLLSLLEQFKKYPLAFECCYNLYFQEFAYSYSKLTGSLLKNLRVLASKGGLSRQDFARSILILENLPSHLASELHELLKERAVSTETLQSVHELLRSYKKDVLILKRAFNALDPENTLRDTLCQLKLTLDDINKTILISDGFDPDLVAAEIDKAIKNYEGTKLGQIVYNLIALKNGDSPNPKIPQDVNWTTEMRHQIRCSYEKLANCNIVQALHEKNVPLKGIGINKISHLLYSEVSSNVIDLYKELQDSQADGKKIEAILKEARPRLRIRINDMYSAYFGTTKNSESLETEVSNRLKNSDKLQAIQLLLKEAQKASSEIVN